LVSKPANGKNEFLFNRRTLGVTDAATWLSRSIDGVGGVSLLASGTVQSTADIDGDGWADQAQMRRWGVRPRFTGVDAEGRSLLVTARYGYHDRDGGTLGSAVARGGVPVGEGWTTRRGDIGARAILPLRDSGSVALRFALATTRRRREFGLGPMENDETATG